MYNNLPHGDVINKTAVVSTGPVIELETNTYNILKGFFESRKFGKVAADIMAVTLIKQAKQDNYNPLDVLNTLKGLDTIELTSVIKDILNYNRFKTSYLGTKEPGIPFPPVNRNIVP